MDIGGVGGSKPLKRSTQGEGVTGPANAPSAAGAQESGQPSLIAQGLVAGDRTGQTRGGSKQAQTLGQRMRTRTEVSRQEFMAQVEEAPSASSSSDLSGVWEKLNAAKEEAAKSIKARQEEAAKDRFGFVKGFIAELNKLNQPSFDEWRRQNKYAKGHPKAKEAYEQFVKAKVEQISAGFKQLLGEARPDLLTHFRGMDYNTRGELMIKFDKPFEIDMQDGRKLKVGSERDGNGNITFNVDKDGISGIRGLRVDIEGAPIDPKIKRATIREGDPAKEGDQGIGVKVGWLAHLFAPSKGVPHVGPDTVFISKDQINPPEE